MKPSTYRPRSRLEIFFVNGPGLILHDPSVTLAEVESAILEGGVIRLPSGKGIPDLVINASTITYVQEWPA